MNNPIHWDYYLWRRARLPAFLLLLMVLLMPYRSWGQIELGGTVTKAFSTSATEFKTELINLKSADIGISISRNFGIFYDPTLFDYTGFNPIVGSDIKNGLSLYLLKLLPRSNLTPSSSGLILN